MSRLGMSVGGVQQQLRGAKAFCGVGAPLPNWAGSRSTADRFIRTLSSTPQFPPAPHIHKCPSPPILRCFSSCPSPHHPIVHILGDPNLSMSSSSSKPGVDFDQSVGHDAGTQPVSWNRRDLLTYAVSIGVGPKDLDYAYEREAGFRAFPTYPVVLGLKGTSQDTTVFSEMVSSRSAVPGFPSLDLNTIVHGEQSIEMHAPIPVVSGEGWKLEKRICAVHDRPNGLVMETEVRLISPVGRNHATMVGSSFYRGGSQGTGFSRSLITKPPTPKAPARDPDFVLAEKTTLQQAMLYRLSGDYNPIHIDAGLGEKVGLGGTILHGLCSFGFAARAVLKAVDANDGVPANTTGAKNRFELEAFAVRFTSPVRPGDELETKVWLLGDKDGKREIAFEQFVKNTGKKSLGGGYARVVQVANKDVTRFAKL
ncbi:related to Estradiol 17 beta-dehydrogenase 4 [Sporisorium reilianum SRZ2]|uniref:Related to Estradiol 17 beta-dehydrogenase 4 n=1 Tax=Sporisorium reilianum (strain SRZ2) TaxID=999809 RepID=E6ZXK9_SPORE|nr:related to Estradiol 17 beta-dehydrogenase 4 [Sporisorium reilianum SRZ2]